MKNSTNSYLSKKTKVGKLFYAFLLICLITFKSEAQKSDQNKTINVPMASSDNPPVMDGILSADEGWNLNQLIDSPINLASYDCSLTPGPACNNTITWGAQWDGDYLYIACKVIDDKITANDLFEIFLGMGAKDNGCPKNSQNWPRLYNSTDFQLQLLHSDKAFTSPQDAQSMVNAFTWKDGTDGYVIEVALIWEEMQFFLTNPPAVEPGYTILFDISSSDADVAGAARTCAMRWNEKGSDRAWTDNASFGKLILSADPATGVNDMKNIVSSVSLVPNPSNGTDVDLNIESLQAQNLNISIMNVMSQTLSSSAQSINTGNNTIQLNTSDLSNGMYWVSISNGKSSMAKKLVVNK